MAEEIKRHLFAGTSEPKDPLRELQDICSELEESMARIPSSPWKPRILGGTGGERKVKEPMGGPSPVLDQRVGLIHLDIHNHSWRPAYPAEWISVSRESAIGGLGLLARREEIQRFGHKARRVFRTKEPPPLFRAFARAITEGEMARREDNRSWKRRGGQEDWMEEDDLLGGDLH